MGDVIMRIMSFTVELPDSVAEALRLAPPDAGTEVRKGTCAGTSTLAAFWSSERPGSLCGLTK
jgi:hypothetical protein